MNNDISACASKACPKRTQCARHPTSGRKPSTTTPWGDFDTSRKPLYECGHFWPVENSNV